MAVKSSGQLSMGTDIVGEFGGSAPHALSEYYGGAGLVPAGANPGVPTSGQIGMSDMYGTVAATVLTISSNTNNYDIGAAAIAAGGDKSTPVILTINSGVTVGSTSSSTPAMYTGTGWGAGTTINITNNGSIVGASGSNTSGYMTNGGRGGNGGGWAQTGSNGQSGSAGSGSADSANNGGNAFEHSQTADNNLSVIFDTAGTRTGGSAGTKTIYGGGGGGGGGGFGSYCAYYQYGIGGSGGGGGAGSGQAGSGGSTNHNGNSGQSGSSSSGGSGGARKSVSGGYGGAGGNGGGNSSSGGGGETGKRYCGCYWGARYDYSGGSGGSGGSNGTASGSAGSVLSGNTGQIS